MQVHDIKKDLPIASEISKASDRAAAIVATSWLDGKLTSAIKQHLVEDKTTFDKLFKPGRPMGNLGLKIDLGFLLRLYSKESRDDMSTLASIRNKFAHWDDPTDFSNRDIRKLVETLGLPRRVWGHIPDFKFPTPPYSKDDARKQFMETVSIACTFLVHATQHPEKHARM